MVCPDGGWSELAWVELDGGPPHGQAGDPVSEVVAAAQVTPRTPDLNLRQALSEAQDLLTQARGDGAYRASLPRTLALVRQHPNDIDLQVTAARLLMEGRDSRALAAWLGILRRHPTAPEPFRMILRTVARRRGIQAAKAILDARYPEPERVEGEEELLSMAFGMEELSQPTAAETVFRIATERHPSSRRAWSRLIQLEETRGAVAQAKLSAAKAVANCGGKRFSDTLARISSQLKALEGYLPDLAANDSPLSVKAATAILAGVMPRRRLMQRTPARNLGATMMVTGSLGSGGAERQLVATVLALQRAIVEGRSIDGHEILGPVLVACRSLSPKLGNDFFLSALRQADVAVTEFGRLPPYGGDARYALASAYREIVEQLPVRVQEGVVRLVEYIRFEAPEVVQIWQDGMVLAAGLAAVMAGTPRVVLSVRTLPPTDRANRWRAELEPLYRALLAAPGVVLTANSAMVAQRYEDWLDLPKGLTPVIQNGVEKLPQEASMGEAEAWSAFADRTRGASFTVGAVMRLDQNKRPLEWLTVADRLRRQRPECRFVIVGEGPLRREAMDHAARLGVADRVLFTGRSASVGFWLAQFDALMLLSQFEGMPNALIEAQLAGVPVVTTPAGGAAETVLEGSTGFVLSNADTIDLGEAVGRLDQLIAMSEGGRRTMQRRAIEWAQESFSVDVMLTRTVDLFKAPLSPPMVRAS
jgi:hypothetical protein